MPLVWAIEDPTTCRDRDYTGSIKQFSNDTCSLLLTRRKSLWTTQLSSLLKVNTHHGYDLCVKNNVDFYTLSECICCVELVQNKKRDVVSVIVWLLDLCNQRLSPLKLNPVHGEVYSIQHYVVKFVSDLRQVGGFLQVLRFPPSINPTATI